MSDTSLVFNILAKDKASAVFDRVKGAAAAAGVAIGAALAAGAAQMLERSKTDALLAAQLGAGTAAAAAAGEAAGAVYARGVVATVEEANAAVKAAIQNALVPDGASTAQIDAVASKVATLAAVMQEDAGRVSAAVSTMLKTGMAKNAEEAFDILQTGVEMGLNKTGDMLDSLTEYPTILKTIGLSGQQAFGLIAQGMEAGAPSSDKIIDAMKELSLRAVNGSKTTSDAFRRLGVDGAKAAADIAAGGPRAAGAVDLILDKLRGMPATAERAQIIQNLFGGPGEDLGASIFALDVDKASASLDGMSGASDRAGKALEQSAGAKLDAFKRRAQEALIDKLAQAVPHIEATFGWLSRNSGWVTPLAVGLGILAAVIGTIVGVTKVWTAVQTALNVVMSMNPVGLVIIAVAALIGLIVLIATKTTWFQTIWNTVWGAIKTAAAAVWDWLVGAAEWVWQKLGQAASAIGGFFTGLWGGIKTGATGAWQWIVDKFTAVVSFVKGLPGKITAAAAGMWNGLKTAFRNGLNWIISKWNGFSLTLGGGSVLGMKIPSVTLSTPNLPYLATGGNIVQSGLAVVGERGPEIVSLTRGAQVTPLSRTSAAPAGGGGRGRGRLVIIAGDREAVDELRRLQALYGF